MLSVHMKAIIILEKLITSYNLLGGSAAAQRPWLFCNNSHDTLTTAAVMHSSITTSESNVRRFAEAWLTRLLQLFPSEELMNISYTISLVDQTNIIKTLLARKDQMHIYCVHGDQ